MNERSAESDFRFAATDGYSLAATLRRPAAGPQKGFVLIASATATPRHYYGRFASYLAEHGFSVMTFDYRGIGDSRPPSLRGFECRMRDWAALDLSAAVDFAAREAGRRFSMSAIPMAGRRSACCRTTGKSDARCSSRRRSATGDCFRRRKTGASISC